MNGLFNFDDNFDLSKSDFDKAVKGLIEHGLLESVVVDGEIFYKLNNLGLQVVSHLYTDNKFKN